MDGKIDWRIQLNVRNLTSDGDPVVLNKDAFGRKAQYYLTALRTWSVSNTFRF